MILEFDGEEIELDLEVGEITTISWLLEKMSVACGYGEDYLTDRYAGLSDEDIKDKCSSCGIDGENDCLIVFFEIIECDKWNVNDTKIKITRID